MMPPSANCNMYNPMIGANSYSNCHQTPPRCLASHSISRLRRIWLIVKGHRWYEIPEELQCYQYEGHAQYAATSPGQDKHHNHLGDSWK